MTRKGCGAAIAALLLFSSASVLALDVNQDEALHLRRQGKILPFEVILKVAMARYPGAQLLETDLEHDDGELIYEIELLTADGVVREVEIDARDARVVRDKMDD